MNTMPELHIVHLYAHSMSTYGDAGNVLCLAQRARWRGFNVQVHLADIGQPLPKHADLYFFGGGQDTAQSAVSADLLSTGVGERIRKDCQEGVPMLAVCGGYQLLGTQFLPADAPPIPGIGLLPIETTASNKRMIGNLIIQNSLNLDDAHPYIVGFENHSGQTHFLTSQAQPLGTVITGYGNTSNGKTEGCVLHNTIGCYLHGSVLPKNPHLADWLLKHALQRIDPSIVLSRLDDSLEWQTHQSLLKRFS